MGTRYACPYLIEGLGQSCAIADLQKRVDEEKRYPDEVLVRIILEHPEDLEL